MSYVNAIVLLLSFVTFVATSSPHRVHHLGDMTPSSQRLAHAQHTHHAPDHAHPPYSGQPAQPPHAQHTPQVPACVVLLLLQSLPMLVAEHIALSVPLTLHPCDVSAAEMRPRVAPTLSCLARSPPLVIV
jgi:hypothetical protein